jgi:RimK family alpha-L-glutamate ligase
MRIVILSARQGWHTSELVRAFGERGHIVVVLPYEGLVARLGRGTTPVSPASREEGSSTSPRAGAQSSDAAAILDADAVLPRIIPNGSLEQIIYRVDALHWIEDSGVPAVNSPRAIERCVDQFYTTALLERAGLAVPETVVCERIDEAMDAVRRLGSVVIKPLFGSMGHGMVRVDNPDVAFRVFRAIGQTRAVLYVQQALDHGGSDVRVLVAGGRIAGAMTRHAANGEWRTNIAQGGVGQAISLPAAWAEMALRACGAVGADYAGVDLLPTQDGRVYVLEVNGIPAWEGLQRATGADVTSAIVDAALDKVRRAKTPVDAEPCR